jgi:hypothetical protein
MTGSKKLMAATVYLAEVNASLAALDSHDAHSSDLDLLAYGRAHGVKPSDCAAQILARRSKAKPKKWTLTDVKYANQDAGQFFFSRQTMRFFGDTMRSFAVRNIGGAVYVDRIRPMRDRSGRSMGGVGDRRLFDPATGHIGMVIREEPSE